MNDMEKLCTLCIDEISLKSHLYYSIPADKIIGLEDFGGGYGSNKIATSAVTILIRSISGNWKQPIGYALVNGSCSTDILDGLVQEAIDKLDAIGLKVKVVMSDMGSNFHSWANYLGITPEKPWFVHNKQVIFLMFDPPHLIKSIRNNLMKYSFKFAKYVASWSDIEVFSTPKISSSLELFSFMISEKKVKISIAFEISLLYLFLHSRTFVGHVMHLSSSQQEPFEVCRPS